MCSMLQWIKTHKYALAGLYLFVFLAGFGLLELVVKEPKIIIHCPVDDWIPFCEWFVIPYFLWYAWVPVFMIWFMVKSRYDYLKLCFVMLGGATICLSTMLIKQHSVIDVVCGWLLTEVMTVLYNGWRLLREIA